jgi:carboxyl-terminal processing protease
MKTRILIACLLLAAVARAGEPGPMDYSQWQNRPREKFSDAEKAFQKAKDTLLKEYLDDKLTEEDLYRSAVQGMLAGAGGRKWDALLSPTEHGEIKGDMAGEMVGIGIEIKFEEDSGMTGVLNAIPGSPAEKAGLRAGDKILKIDGKSFKGQQFRDVVYAIRGKAGKPVTLTLLRDDAIVQKTVVRAPIAWSPVTEQVLPGQVGLISIRAFTEKTPGQLRAALKRLAAQAPKGIVLDLRHNEGGMFEKVVESAGALLPKGRLVVTAIGRGGREDAHKTAEEPAVTGVPIAVLVDGTTASGAEILAGALKHGIGARVVGKRTHGKWNVQRILDLPNRYAMKYTVAVFKSAKGELLDGKGLEPDLEVDMAEKAVENAQRLRDPQARLAADAQLRTAVAVLKL